jgi:hypothetical protein
MPVKAIKPSEPIDLRSVPIVIYGPPSAWKTTLCQTAESPITLDFDQGIHRAENRQMAYQFDTWADVVDFIHGPEVKACKTVVIDTLGRMLELMFPPIIAEAAKNRGSGGVNLSPAGYGILGSWFSAFLVDLIRMGKQVVMVCHEKEEKSEGKANVRPDLPGTMAWKEVHRRVDLIGRIRYESGRRFLDFNPTEGAEACKNAAGFQPFPLPDLRVETNYLARLLADARERIGKTSVMVAQRKQHREQWDALLASDLGLASLNEKLGSVGQLSPTDKREVWEQVKNYARSAGWVFDEKTRLFVVPENQPEPESNSSEGEVQP